MEVPKRKRIKDRVTLKEMRKPYCEVCGRRAYGGVHHITPRSCFGPDIRENGIQLCHECHIFKAHGGHYSKEFLYDIVAKREGKTIDEVIEAVENCR